jgi:hypothetical protein
MANRASRVVLLAVAILPIVATIGAPPVDALSRAVAKLFRENAPESAGPVASVSIDSLTPGDTADVREPAGLVLQHSPAISGRAEPIDFQSLQIDTPLTVQPAADRSSRRGLLITSLYVSFIALQALDAHSTIRALDRGARESNPMIAPFAENTAALIALKAGTAAGVIYMTDRVRRHNRVASIVIMAAANSVYATIVARNYRVAQQAGR